ncbi:diguanylate cyclase [bacterium]|nr:diguanylate cyclase [bacterium]
MRYLAPEAAEQVGQHYRRHLGGERDLGIIPAVARTRDGRAIAIELDASVVTLGGRTAELVTVTLASGERGLLSALGDSQELLRDLIDARGDELLLLDADGTILDANDAAELAYERPRRELVGRRLRDLVSSGKPGMREARLTRAARECAPERFLEARENGRFEMCVYPLNANGAPRRLVMIGRRIPEMEDAPVIDAAEPEFGSFDAASQPAAAMPALEPAAATNLLNSFPGMAYRAHGGNPWALEYASRGARKLAGISAGAILRPGAYARLIHPEDREMVWNSIQQGIVNGSRYHVIYRLVGAIGDDKWVSEQGVAVRDKQGQVIALEGFITDIDVRRRAEIALRHSEERYRTLIEQATDGIFVCDVAGRFVDANSAFCDILGFSRTEVLSRRITELFAAIRDPNSAPLRSADLRDGQSIVMERRVRRHDGVVIDVEISRKLLTTGLVQGVLRDVTERRRMEEALRHAAAHDELTGLFNRRRIFEEVRRAIAGARRHRKPLALAICDLDNFKRINDTHGHNVGDDVLAAIGRAINTRLGSGAYAGRFGGDEFLVVFEDRDASSADKIMTDLHGELKRIAFGVSSSPPVTFTCGIAELRRDHLGERELLADADAALYQAKHQGRDAIRVYRKT